MIHVCDEQCDRRHGFCSCKGKFKDARTGICEIYVPFGTFPRPQPKRYTAGLTDEEREARAIRESPDYARAMAHSGADIW